jgi:hypothetical protein
MCASGTDQCGWFPGWVLSVCPPLGQLGLNFVAFLFASLLCGFINLKPGTRCLLSLKKKQLALSSSSEYHYLLAA